MVSETTLRIFEKAMAEGIEIGRDRLAEIIPQCRFGELGICCRNCYMGPCRIDPFGEGANKGVCGATADTIVTRNLLREAVGGAASHMGHARQLALTLKKVAEGKVKDYEIKNKDKLMTIAKTLGIKTEEREINAIALDVANKALEDFSRQDGAPMNWLRYRAPKKEYEMWEKLGLVVSNAHNEIEIAMHRTSMGNDADPINLLLATLRMGIVDGYAGLTMATDIQDILFGTPTPVQTKAGLGVLEEDYVNLAVHGHNPLLSEKVLEWAEKLEDEAKKVGAKGINVVGVCCTGNELTMRHGIPMAAHNLQSELVLLTGAIDAMIVDVQCIWPSYPGIAEHYHTKIITTEPFVKLPGATHIDFEPEHANEAAKKIIQTAIEAFKNRDKKKVFIPKAAVASCWSGFSVETIVNALSKVNPQDPLKPVIDNIVAGNIYGAVGFAGCPSIKMRDTEMTEKMVKELLKNNVLVVTTGCTAYICAQGDLVNPTATENYCGDGLKAVLTAVGKAIGLDGPLPPVWHTGSCVDNSRIIDILAALAGKLNVKISQLPVAASAPEFVQEKAVAIGSWVLALGLLLHLAPAPRILGSPIATKVLTEDLEKITGGKAFIEYDPQKAVARILEHIRNKRKELGLTA